MSTKERKKLKETIPEIHRKSWIVGGIGGAIGAGIGGYISRIKGDNIYTGIGAGIGFIAGIISGLFIGKKINLKSFMAIERIKNLILGIASFSLSIAGIIGFILTERWIGLIGAVFFGLGGIYLLRKKT